MTYNFDAMNEALSSGKYYEPIIMSRPYRLNFKDNDKRSTIPYTRLSKAFVRKPRFFPVSNISVPFPSFGHLIAAKASKAAQAKLDKAAKLRTDDIPFKIIGEYLDNADAYLQYVNCINQIFKKEIIPSKELALYNTDYRSRLASEFVRQDKNMPFFWSERTMLIEARVLPVYLNLGHSEASCAHITSMVSELSKLSTNIQAISFSFDVDYENEEELYSAIAFFVELPELKYLVLQCLSENAKMYRLSNALIQHRSPKAVPLILNLRKFPLAALRYTQLSREINGSGLIIKVLS